MWGEEKAAPDEPPIPTHLVAGGFTTGRRFSSCSHTVRKETAANAVLPFRVFYLIVEVHTKNSYSSCSINN